IFCTDCRTVLPVSPCLLTVSSSTEIYALSLHDALPIYPGGKPGPPEACAPEVPGKGPHASLTRSGPYLVGSRTIFVRDPARPFDPWNEVYGSDDYKTLLDHLAEIGEPRTLVTEVWYPVAPPPGC